MENGHAWIAYLDGEILKHIDVYEGITKKSCNKDIDEYFLLTTEELRMKNRHSGFEEAAREVEKVLKEKRIKNGFKVIDKSDKER